jgi:hypothetical protein
MIMTRVRCYIGRDGSAGFQATLKSLPIYHAKIVGKVDRVKIVACKCISSSEYLKKSYGVSYGNGQWKALERMKVNVDLEICGGFV